VTADLIVPTFTTNVKVGQPPIRCVFGGKIHAEEMEIGAVAVVAGSRMVEGGGLEIIPATGSAGLRDMSCWWGRGKGKATGVNDGSLRVGNLNNVYENVIQHRAQVVAGRLVNKDRGVDEGR
jgi:hypothetical protein